MFPLPSQFAELAFPDISFGDQRLSHRFQNVLAAMLEHPQEALPDKFLRPNDYFAGLDFLNHPATSHALFIETHQVALLQRLENDGPSVVLFIHDSTDLDFSGQKTLEKSLGQIGNGGGRGWICHNSLAVDPDRQQIFGLANQILHVRPVIAKAEGVAAKRERADRESRLWLDAIDTIGPAPARKRWIHVADRGADTFELLQALNDRGQRFVIRSSYNRALILDKGDGQPPQLIEQPEEASDHPGEPVAEPAVGPHLLHDRMRTLPALTTWGVQVSAGAGRSRRVAVVQASNCQMVLKAPHVRRGDYRKEGVVVSVIRVWEENAPEGEKPLEWFLLSSEPITDEKTLVEAVRWYESRWVVEEFHKGQKTGVGIEELQLQDAQSVAAAVALLSVVALALVNLRVSARDAEQAQRPAAEVVPPLWVLVLSIWRYGEGRPMSVREFTLALGRLGGHLNRKGDGLPGWITLWRGWERLHTMLLYETARAKCNEL